MGRREKREVIVGEPLVVMNPSAVSISSPTLALVAPSN